jgi:phenylpyruvate tautomerase PptA (4-oxalocrotonate tautomerase family)
MPFVCLEIPVELTQQTADAIRLGVKGAIHKHLASKDPKFDFVALHEVSEQIAGVTIDLRPGRTAQQKQSFVDEISVLLGQQLGISAEGIYVVFREIAAENHYCGGHPIVPFTPR